MSFGEVIVMVISSISGDNSMWKTILPILTIVPSTNAIQFHSHGKKLKKFTLLFDWKYEMGTPHMQYHRAHRR